MIKPKFEPYHFRRRLDTTQFFYGDTIVFDITNMADDVAKAITLQLNIAFSNGHEMTVKSFEKTIQRNEKD